MDVRDSTEGFAEIVKIVKGEVKGDKDTIKQLEEISNFLNHYEVICIGIIKGIIDERICSSWMRSNLIRSWRDATPIIDAAREGNPRIFIFFKTIAEKWIDEEERDKRKAHKRALK